MMDQKAIIIGGGRIGEFLHSHQTDSVLLRRNDPFPQDSSGPIYLAVRNDDLSRIIQSIPQKRHADLVFLQNGMLQPLLARYGLSGNTQAILYFAVPTIGARAEDGGNTIAWGKWAPNFCTLLKKCNIHCKCVSHEKFMDQMFEKLLWNSIFGLMCEVFQCTVGDALAAHSELAFKLFGELKLIAEEYSGRKLDNELWTRLCEYTLKIPTYRGALKEYDWRNGFFVGHRSTPTHSELLSQVKKGTTSIS